MTRTAAAAIVAGLLTFCAVLFALTAPTAPASADAAPAVAETADTPQPVRIATVYGDGDQSIESDGPDAVTPKGTAVRSDAQGTDGAGTAEDDAVRSDSEDGADSTTEDGADSDTDRAVPATDSDQDGTVTAEDDQDGTDPDALPADAPRACVILDMGAAACESFVNPAPGEVSVAVIYSDDDEHAIVETIAYDEHGPIDYVDFWEGETTPSE